MFRTSLEVARASVPEVIEQVVHADRVGSSRLRRSSTSSSRSSHISRQPFRALVGVCPADEAHHLPDARPRAPVPQSDDPRVPDRPVLPDGTRAATSSGPCAATAGSRRRAGVPVVESRDRYEESLDILFKALEEERFSYDGQFYKIDDSHIVPRPTSSFRVFAGGTSDRTYELAAERGWAIVVPPLLPYAALKDQLDLYLG